MKFGVFTIVPWHESVSQERALNESLEIIEMADELGIDEVWLGEHRFSRHGLLSGIFSFAGAVAARTKRLRIGTAVVVLPLHNPIHVAEEMAMLDVITGGRIEFGMGSGYQRQEFDGMGIDITTSRERFRESVDVIQKSWTEETLTFHGKFTHVDDIWVIPKPIQKPHPSHVRRRKHQPGHHRVGRQPPGAAHFGRADGHPGTGPGHAEVVAGQDG